MNKPRVSYTSLIIVLLALGVALVFLANNPHEFVSFIFREAAKNREHAPESHSSTFHVSDPNIYIVVVNSGTKPIKHVKLEFLDECVLINNLCLHGNKAKYRHCVKSEIEDKVEFHLQIHYDDGLVKEYHETLYWSPSYASHENGRTLQIAIEDNGEIYFR